MGSQELPQWLVEIGRSPQHRETGRPVPPIGQSLRAASELDPTAAAKLEADFRLAIESCTKEDEYDLNARILDAVTGKRLSSVQGVRLLRALFGKFDGGYSMSRVSADGTVEDLNRWGAA